VFVILGLALAPIALAAAAVRLAGRRERDQFIAHMEELRADALIDSGSWNAMR